MCGHVLPRYIPHTGHTTLYTLHEGMPRFLLIFPFFGTPRGTRRNANMVETSTKLYTTLYTALGSLGSLVTFPPPLPVRRKNPKHCPRSITQYEGGERNKNYALQTHFVYTAHFWPSKLFGPARKKARPTAMIFGFLWTCVSLLRISGASDRAAEFCQISVNYCTYVQTGSMVSCGRCSDALWAPVVKQSFVFGARAGGSGQPTEKFSSFESVTCSEFRLSPGLFCVSLR